MDEKMRVLKMVEEGKISAEQAIDLLDALGGNQLEIADNKLPGLTAGPDSYENKMLRIVVDSPEGDKVNIQLPVKIIQQVLKVTGKLPIKGEEMQSIDLEALANSVLECLENKTLGNIVDVNAADGSTVKVFIG